MKITRILILVFALFFLLGATVYIPHGFVNKWGVKSVYADPPMGLPPGPPSELPPKPTTELPEPPQSERVPEPSSLILLGIGFAAVGGYAAYKFRQNKKNSIREF